MIDSSNPKFKHLTLVSNPSLVQRRAKEQGYGEIFISTRKGKKYMIMNPKTHKYIHFGSIDYQDFTSHQDQQRRQRYLQRANNIRGDWKHDKYSPNYLSIHLLW